MADQTAGQQGIPANANTASLEALPDGGKIRLEAVGRSERVVLTVAGNGPGLDNETALRIFEPGFTTSGNGLRGIGLAGSRQLLKCCDGRLELDCRVTAVRYAPSAMAVFQPGAFGLALVDQTLPGQSGLELAARLKQRDPCLVMALITGWGQEKILASADRAIVDLTASKPLEWTRIIDLLSQGEILNRERRKADRRSKAKG